jgi:hypothetical protein
MMIRTMLAWGVAPLLLGSVGATVVATGRPAVARLQVGDRLPPLTGDLLTGTAATLPDVAEGRIALLALGFTYGSRLQVEAWAEEFRALFAVQPAVALYEVPMMGSAARLGRWFIDSGMRRGTPPALQRFVMTVYGNADAWKARVAFDRPDDAYLVLVDGQGVVRWLSCGPVDADRLRGLASVVEGLLGQPPAGPDR